MRSAIYGVIFTAFLVIPCVAQGDSAEKQFPAPNYESHRTGIKGELDGKALLCTSKSQINPVFGLIFDQGKVSRHEVDGYSKVIEYTKPYDLDGTNTGALGFHEHPPCDS